MLRKRQRLNEDDDESTTPERKLTGHRAMKRALLRRQLVHPAEHVWRYKQGQQGINAEAQQVLRGWGSMDPDERQILDCDHMTASGKRKIYVVPDESAGPVVTWHAL